MADGDATSGLPRWPAGASDMPDSQPLPDRPLDGWLVVAAVVYTVTGFGVLLAGGGRMGPAAFGPEVVLCPALLAVAMVVGVKLQGGALRWSSIAAFAAWIALVAFGQLWVWAQAVASV